MKISLQPVIVTLLCLIAGHYYDRSSVILLYFGYLMLQLIIRMTSEITINYMMCVLAVLQWLIGPVVYYSDLNPGMTFEITKMQVREATYFDFAFPATLTFCLGLLLFKVNSIKFNAILDFIRKNNNSLTGLAKNLIIIAFFIDIFKNITPIQIKQYVFFIGYLKFMGLSILALDYYFSRTKSSLRYLLLSLTLVVIGVVKELMFGEFVFSIALIVLILMPFVKPKFYVRITSVIIIASIVIAIQLVKPVSRTYMWKSKGETTFSELFNIIKSNNILSIENMKSKGFVGYSIARFNQGSIISWTMSRVPRQIPFENGKTVVSSTLGAFIPRLLWPNKPLMGKDMYVKYTGLKLEGASYGISQLGESYVNFGVNGSIYFMFILGLIFNLIQNTITLNALKKIGLYFILPILFLHGIKVETDITRSLGFIIRYFIFIYLVNMFLIRAFNKKLY